MGIFSKVEDAAKGIKDDYEKAIARGKEIEVEAKADVRVGIGEVREVGENIYAAFETLEAQALKEVAAFAQSASDSLTKLSDYAARLGKDIASKSDALTQVKAAIDKLRAVAPAAAGNSNTSDAEPAATFGTAGAPQVA